MTYFNKRYSIVILAVSIFILSPKATFAQQIQTLSGEKITVSSLNKQIEQIMDTLKMPGLSIAIINHSTVVYHEVFGVANAVSKEPITQKSIFEGASLSKPIFAYFAMKMVDKGILDLDKPLHEYLPHPAIDESSQEDYQLITPRMVLSHSTGFPNFSNNQVIKLAFKPDTDFSYSGEAYQYLAAIIGQLNGVGWKAGLNKIFEEEVTQPLGMDHTSFLWNDYLAQNKVYGHNAKGQPTDNHTGGWSGKTFNSFSSIHSEAKEYAKFIIAMLKRGGLKKDTFDEMLKAQTPLKEGNEIHEKTGQTAWGLGFAQKPTPHGLMHLHTGNNHDFQAYTMFVPEQEYGLVIFTNSDKMLDFVQSLGEIIGEQF